MKALVTGAAGFIGSFLCPELLRRDMEIGAVALPGEKVERLRKGGMEVVFGDLSRPESVRGMADGIDVVLHLAGRVIDWGPRKAFYAAIFDTTTNLLAESAGKVSRFVYVSSVCALGMGIHLKGWKEDHATTRTASLTATPSSTRSACSGSTRAGERSPARSSGPPT